MTTTHQPDAAPVNEPSGAADAAVASGGVGAPVGKRRRFRLASRGSIKRLALLFLCMVIAAGWLYRAMIVMPGRSYAGALPPLTQAQRALAAALRAHVERLAGELGGRSIFFPRKLAESAVYLDDTLSEMGYTAQSYSYAVRGTACPNIAVELAGTSKPGEIIVIGAHYDAYQGAPAADDNASGVAAVLELARWFTERPRARTIRFVLFVNEEPPCFMTEDMGSLVYAKQCKERGDDVVAMLSLESIGFYSDKEGSQKYPKPLARLYPSRGDFIAFVGSFGSRRIVRRCIWTFREKAEFPSEGAALFEGVPGVGWSDHWAFWRCGYPALMVTDTAPYRNPHYHTVGDRADTLDYERMARVVEGVREVILELSGE